MQPSSSRRQLPLFVYGTLREGESNWRAHLAGRTRRSRPARLRAAALRYNAGFPCVDLTSNPADAVIGELVEVEPAEWEPALAAIDRLEGYRLEAPEESWYHRIVVAVEVEGEPEGVTAYCYVGHLTEPGERIASGDWKKR